MNRRLRFLLLLLISYAGAQSLLRLILFFYFLARNFAAADGSAGHLCLRYSL